MAADSFHATAEISNDPLLSALADRWRHMLQAPAASPAGIGFRPAREAAEMRRLYSQAGMLGAPPDVIARLWRSLCGDLMAARGLKAVYVAGGDIAQSLDGARGYFGFGPNLLPVVEVREALERALEQQGVLACVPWPEHAGSGQWWPMLNEGRFRSLAIVAGWPSLPGSPSLTPRMAVVGRIGMESSGDDETLATAHDDQYRAERMLAEFDLKADVVARARSLALIRIREFVSVDDRRIDLARREGLDGLRIVGVRPRP
jgi:chorismate mutase